MLWKPKKLSSYSSDELQKVGQFSPAFFRYQEILKKTASTFSQKLRNQRIQTWCELVAEIHIHQTHPEKICNHWSHLADTLVNQAWVQHGLDQEELACFALGKLGSQELNLSSDIDLIILCATPCPKEIEIKFRAFTQELTENSEFGFCFRVDYDLRPGGRFAPMIPSFSRTEDHYWTQGQTWERLALVRVRPLCGEKNLIHSSLQLFRSFSYRKYINYSLLDDLKSLRSDIFQYRPDAVANSFNLKLMDGGIRDIELFTHALQVIHGGKIEELRSSSTSTAIDALIQHKCGNHEDLKFLKQLYWELRDAENKSQAQEDSQTHIMKKGHDPDQFDHLQKETRFSPNSSNEITKVLQA